MLNINKVLILFSLCLGGWACEPALDSSTTESTLSTMNRSTTYAEPHRNQFHFSPPANWMNDPNGMVYYEGEYHLFYQYYPDSTVWGPMHWGHAISSDMVHWEHLPIALYPDSLGYIFSGSAVVDWKNSSGFGEAGKPPLIAIFTHHEINGEKAGGNQFQYQSIAYSNDKGRSWTKYAGNPVIPNPGIKDFRDPKVIWHEESEQWIMALAVYDKVMFYQSPNLKDWTFASEFGIPGDDRLWECPDLFPIQVEGQEETKWVLIVSIQKQAPNGGTATAYFVGDFDGNTFKGDPTQQYWADYGKDNYAMVSWSDIPKADGRRLAIGWMSNWQYAQVVPTQNWRSAMTLPRRLSLHQIPEGYRLRSHPVRELQTIEGQYTELQTQQFKGKGTLATSADPHLYKLEVSFEKPSQGSIGLRFSNEGGEQLEVNFDANQQVYTIDRSAAGIVDFSDQFAGLHVGEASYAHSTVDLLIYMDHAAIELFADDGQCVMTDIFFSKHPLSKIEVIGEEVNLLKGRLTRLKSVWK